MHEIDLLQRQFRLFGLGPKSYLMTCGDYVIDKTAPDGGRIHVSLTGQHALFQEMKLPSAPDAVIGLNAGLADYVE